MASDEYRCRTIEKAARTKRIQVLFHISLEKQVIRIQRRDAKIQPVFSWGTTDGLCTPRNIKAAAILPPKREVDFADIGY